MTEKVPEKLYMIRADIGIKSTMFMLTSDKLDKKDIEYIRADLVEPSYGAEVIIRGNGERQDEYILKSVADRRVEELVKPIVEVYEKWKDSDFENVNEMYLLDDLWQAMKATVKQLVEK